jgi:Domain of unknown function (DUF5060)
MKQVLAIFSVLVLVNIANGAEIVSVYLPSDSVPRFSMIEISISLADQYDNPFDPDEIEVNAEFTTPGGDTHTAPGFWFAPYTSELVGENEVWNPAGDGEWRVRFAPLVQGGYSFRITAHDAGGTDMSEEFAFTAIASQNPGFVRVNQNNSRYFAFDDGSPYVALGFNVDWATESSGSFAYRNYLDSLAGGGGNWTRLWMSHFGQGTALEWGDYHWTGYYEGLGRYSQQVAAKLDLIFDHAHELGVFIQLCLHQHSQFESSAWSSWNENPYNEANGGPCASSADYFTNEEALRLSRNLHRYIVARYHAHTSILSWELWNEADLIVGVGQDLMVPWAQGTAAQIRQLDPSAHLVTTSYGSPLPFGGFDLATWDYNNRHMYTYGSMLIGWFLASYRDAQAPLLLSEYGLDWQGGLQEHDTLGVNIHNATWSALMHGYAGGAMNWWWDNYIEPFGLWHLNLAPKAFLAGEDLTRFMENLSVVALAPDARLEACGIYSAGPSPQTAWIWVHDRQSAWWGAMEALPPVESAQATLNISNVHVPVHYSAEVWNTWTGEAVDQISGSATKGEVEVNLPAFERDVAIKLELTFDDADDDLDDDINDDIDDDASNDDSAAQSDDDDSASAPNSGDANNDDDGLCCG